MASLETTHLARGPFFLSDLGSLRLLRSGRCNALLQRKLSRGRKRIGNQKFTLLSNTDKAQAQPAKGFVPFSTTTLG